MQKVGGQAVMEGVMMRNKERVAVAVRLNDGGIKVKRYGSKKMPKFFDWVFMRGVVGLLLMLYDGVKGLIWSANQNLEPEEKISNGGIFLTLFLSLGMGVLFFIGLPFLIASLVKLEGFWFNAVDGILRLGLFLGYILGISYMKDVQKLFRYHGAEHKVVNCYEAGKKLTVKNVKKFSTLNPRCGTSFIFIVLIISILLFCLITGSWYVRLLGRVVLIPVIAGISYELLRLSDRFKKHKFVQGMIAPGMWLQKITTKNPSDKQIEVSIRALKEVIR
ncbi:DUF1385 domain-containing protein [Candidatus Woesearchaeota archaeon]|nr:DUF1385 domain-containing protein [Candidatus Woesearchaeota archaeon]